jgi:hypothetical protein
MSVTFIEIPSCLDCRPGCAAPAASTTPGFCIACGDDAEGVNPDTRRAKCEACGKAVYGLSAQK